MYKLNSVVLSNTNSMVKERPKNYELYEDLPSELTPIYMVVTHHETGGKHLYGLNVTYKSDRFAEQGATPGAALDKVMAYIVHIKEQRAIRAAAAEAKKRSHRRKESWEKR